MSLAPSREPLHLPETLKAQLLAFRRAVWTAKSAEAALTAAFVVLVAYLALFGLDRVWDSPGWARIILFVLAALGAMAVPVALYRWVYRQRRPDQLARLLSRKMPSLGDHLLGVIELAHSPDEQRRSPALVRAAINQVTQDASKRDFKTALPDPRHRLWAGLAVVPVALAVGLLAIAPGAASNAWARLLAPWKPIPRYTFAAVGHLPEHLVVAHGEPFVIHAKLDKNTVWKPAKGVLALGKQKPIVATLKGGEYVFELPAQIDPSPLRLTIGDSIQKVRLEPTLRPELTGLAAEIALPDYLGRKGAIRKDVRGGAVSLVKGSRATFTATASRELALAQVNGRDQRPKGDTVQAPKTAVDGKKAIEFRWRDVFGLAGKEPFTLNVNARDDEAPSLATEDLPRNRVVLDSELLSFKVRAQDDFGVKRIGLEWKGVDDPLIKNPAKGERILAAGGAEKDDLDIKGTFSAQSLGIEPQPIMLRVFAEDYLPGRPRVYSPTYTLFVLNAEQHAIWVTEQLSKWHRQSLEVRDREMALFETNKALRTLDSEEIDRPENRRKIEAQAAAERANGQRLSSLVLSGEDLVKQATRNPEIGVGHLERWAEMLQILKDISGNRMPSVADLLKQGATAPVASNKPTGNNGPKAGQTRAMAGGKGGESKPGAPKPPSQVPAVADVESSQQPANKNAATPPPSKPKAPRLTLAQTTIIGPGASKAPPAPPDAPAAVEEAVVQQQDLLAEFEKISEELNRVLANLEGSTLVKRLKAASRVQTTVAGRINDEVAATFGLPAVKVGKGPTTRLSEMGKQEGEASQKVSVIMDDLQSYFERRRMAKFKTVLEDMKKQDVIGNLRQLGDDIRRENGVSIAQCEYWSDTLDRWAEDLVDPACNGACPGAKSKRSLPPSIVLEVLQILEGEVNLREQTRVTEQARGAVTSEEHEKDSKALGKTQAVLDERTKKVILRILDLPEPEENFGRELKILGAVSDVMGEATDILNRADTGTNAIAAETEAIELLLQSRRINPKRGGGGGSNPGGGGGGTTTDSALALLGKGINEKEVREDRGVSQATGESGAVLPEEFRAGLDEYFNRIERKPAPLS